MSESFSGRLRNECLDVHEFTSIEDARVKLEVWRIDYNQNRPYSSRGHLTPSEYAKQGQKSILEAACDAQANSDVLIMVMMQMAKFPLQVLLNVVSHVIELPNDTDWNLPSLKAAPIKLECDGKPCLTGLDVVVRIQNGKHRVMSDHNDAVFSAEIGQEIEASLLRAIIAASQMAAIEAMRPDAL